MTVPRELVRPGLVARVERVVDGLGLTFALNEHLPLSDQHVPLHLGEELQVLTLPRKLDGIRLVRVRTSDGSEGEVYYTHVHYLCDVARLVQESPTGDPG